MTKSELNPIMFVICDKIPYICKDVIYKNYYEKLHCKGNL